jgi:hypothetical protein
LVRVVLTWARAPALHFLVLGACLFAVGTRPSGSMARPPVVFTAARVAEIRYDYRRTVRAAPTPAELDALVAREADEEMLYREALLLGLDRGDRAVEWRVLEKMRFLYGDAAGDDAEALRRGLALGLERDDVVVRNTLVTKMRLLAKAASRSEEPSGPALERELDAYFQRHRDVYVQPERLSLTHVFLSAAKRGAALEADARVVLGRLRESPTATEAGARLGDAFVSGSVFRSISRGGLVTIFGDGFATAVSGLEPGRWSEPIRSPYGLHLVWVAGREAAGVAPLDAVRPRVLRAYRAERQARYLARMLDELRAAYEVRIENDS